MFCRMTYQVFSVAGMLLCESPDREGAESAAEWFTDRGIPAVVTPPRR